MNINKAIDSYKNALDAMSNAQAGAAQKADKTDEFSQMVGGAIEGAANQLRSAEIETVKAAAGQANIQDVVEALTNAEMTLTTVTAVRDKVIEAYQNILNMPI